MKLFGKSFSPPKAGWAGLVIEDARICMAVVVWDGTSRPRVLRLMERSRGSDLVADLRQLKKDAALARQRCVTILCQGDYQTLLVDAPEVPRQELAEAIRWRIKDMLGMPLERAVVDALILPQASSFETRSRQALAVSADLALVERVAEPFVQADLLLSAVDIPELAQRNLAALCEDENRGLAFLSLGKNGGLLTLTWGGELFSSRRIEAGTALWLDRPAEDRAGAFDRITLELQRSLDYFDRQFSFISISRLVLAGGPELAPLGDFLRQTVYMPVELFDAAAVLDLPDEPGIPVCAALAVIGAALRAEEVPA